MNTYHIVATKTYKKDVKRLVKSGLPIEKLETVIDVLAQGKTLESKYRDHPLKGALRHTRECHIAPNWLLHYAKDDGALILILISTGDHKRVLGIE